MNFYKGSFPFEWSWDDTVAIAKGAGLAAAGGVVAYFGTLEFEMNSFQTIFTAGVVSTLVNALRKWASNTTST